MRNEGGGPEILGSAGVAGMLQVPVRGYEPSEKVDR